MPDTKHCGRCDTIKAIEAFSWKYESRGVRHTYCRECMRAYMRQHYLRNKDIYIRRAMIHNRWYAQEFTRKIWEYLQEHPCVDCGESDPLVLEFDHRDRKLKRIEVSRLRVMGSWRRIMEEIVKCDVRCANCHRRRTAHQFGWRKALLQSEGTTRS
jgi:hypothetical protein